MLRRFKEAAVARLGGLLHSGHLVRGSHRPECDDGRRLQFRDGAGLAGGELAPDGTPLPPKSLRMGYGDDERYWMRATETQEALRKVCLERGIAWPEGGRVLDWGCASGRVIRGFPDEALSGEVWGADQDASCIAWNKAALSPPFRFVTTTCWPHLPFGDGHFDFIYGISVFTHLADLVDLWLVEMSRILRKDGHALFTVHDEHSLEFFRKRGRLPFWLPVGTDLEELEKHEVVVVRGGNWSRVFTIFRCDWIRREWAGISR